MICELCGLRISNLYLEEGFIRVHGKGRKERLVDSDSFEDDSESFAGAMDVVNESDSNNDGPIDPRWEALKSLRKD